MLKSAGWKKLYPLRGPAKQKATDGAIFLKAAKMQKLRLVRMMLDGGVDVNWQNEEGYNALMCVITSHTSDVEDPQASSKYTMVDYLLKVGTDPNARDRNGKTALIHACQLNTSVDIIQLLIVCNADPSIRDFSAISAIDYAQTQQNEAAVRILTHACNMKKSVVFVGEESFPKEQGQMYNYLSVPKAQSVDVSTRRKIGSPKPLKRQNTVTCTGDDDFRRLWEEEVATSREKDGPEVAKGLPGVLRRRNTASTIPSISLTDHSNENESKFDLDSSYYEKKRVETSLFEWEQKSASLLKKANARRVWLDQSQNALRESGRPTLGVICDVDGDAEDNTLSSRVRSLSLTGDDNELLQAPVLERSKSEEHPQSKVLHRQTRAVEITDAPFKQQNVCSVSKENPRLTWNSVENTNRVISQSVDLGGEHPLFGNSQKCTNSGPISAKETPPDVKPKHPHAKFFQSRSNTFHISTTRFKGEELVETI